MRQVIVMGCIVAAAACTSAPAGQNQNNADAGPCEMNPDGVCYPTEDVGISPRKGSIAGNRIQNFKFQGYHHVDTGTAISASDLAAGPQTVQLSDFFDPTGAKYTIIHITVAAFWCGPCNLETDAIKGPGGFAAKLAPSGVVFLQALSDGTSQGKGATQADLSSWIMNHGTNFTEVLDSVPNNKLSVFYDPAAIPFNANIDARSMEVLQAGVGYNPQLDQEIMTWVNWTKSNPAKTP